MERGCSVLLCCCIVNGSHSIFRSKILEKESARQKLHEWYKTVFRCTFRIVKSARDAIKSREDEVVNHFIKKLLMQVLNPSNPK